MTEPNLPPHTPAGGHSVAGLAAYGDAQSEAPTVPPAGQDEVKPDRNDGELDPTEARTVLKRLERSGALVSHEAIPLPLFVGFRLRKSRCDCGETFPTRRRYREHYALVHILGLS